MYKKNTINQQQHSVNQYFSILFTTVWASMVFLVKLVCQMHQHPKHIQRL